jgi:transposase
VEGVNSISPRGELRFKAINGALDADTFIDFLKALVKDADSPVFLILGNHPVHHSKRIRHVIESLEGKLRLFFLPPYSPELDPVESVWGYMKYHQVGKASIHNRYQLVRIVYQLLRRLQKLPQLLRSFFQHSELAYIFR